MTRPLATVASLLALCLAGLGVTACDKLEGAAQGSRSRMATPARQSPSFEQNVTIEFDAPSDFSAKNASGRFSITGFQVGFFQGRRLVRAIEIPRDSVRVSGAKIHLSVPLAPVTSPNDSSVGIKVRPLSAGALGEWSQTAGSVTLPVADTPTRPSGAGGGADRRARRESRRGKSPQLTTAEVDKHEPLKVALMEVLDGITLNEAVGSFSRVQDLATAIVLSSKLRLPFAELCRAVQATPRKSVAEALKTLRPSINATAEIRAASGEAGTLIGRRERPERQRPQAQGK